MGGMKRETMLVSVPGMNRGGVEDRNHRDTENKENTGFSRLVLRVLRVLRVSAASAVCVDVLGTLYAVGTAASPITFTDAVSEGTGAWGYVYLRGPLGACTLDYVTWQYGGGVNDAAGSTLRHRRGLTCTYGLATLSASDVASCTLQYNATGLLVYGEAAPLITASNVLSNTLNAWVDQAADVAAPGCWWGQSPPDATWIWDHADDQSLGALDVSDAAAGWVAWRDLADKRPRSVLSCDEGRWAGPSTNGNE